jgi:hypothetical protein
MLSIVTVFILKKSGKTVFPFVRFLFFKIREIVLSRLYAIYFKKIREKISSHLYVFYGFAKNLRSHV